MVRLPQVGSDAGDWGTILNNFLDVEHNPDGTLKSSGSLAVKYTKPSGGIPITDLSSNVQSALAQATASAPVSQLDQRYASFASLAANPESLFSGAITRDANGAVTSAAVIWPDGTAGTYTADTVSISFPGAVDAYHITYDRPGAARTYTQKTVTRDSTSGVVTNRPAIEVSQ